MKNPSSSTTCRITLSLIQTQILFFLSRRHNHNHLAAFKLRKLFYNRQFFQIFFNTLQQFHAYLSMRHFSPTKTYGNLGFISLAQKLGQTSQFNLIITFFSSRSILYFFNLDLFLFLFSSLLLFVLFKLIFTVIHYLTNRRICIR